MKPHNRLAEVMAELDAERRRDPKEVRKAKPKRRDARVSFLLQQGGRIVELVVDVDPEEPPARTGWSPAVKTDVGWFSCQIVR